MENKWKQAISVRTLSGVIVVCVGVLFWYVLSHLGSLRKLVADFLTIIGPFIYGFVIAYILNAPANWFAKRLERSLCKKKDRRRLCWGFAVLFVMLLMVLLLAGISAIVVPQLASSVMMLAENVQTYADNIQDYAEGLLDGFSFGGAVMEYIVEAWADFSVRVTEYLGNALPGVMNWIIKLSSSVTSLVMGFVISVYMLLSRDVLCAQTKKLLAAVLSKRMYQNVMRIAEMSNGVFRGYVSGQLTDAMIVGIITFVALTVFRMPYSLLIAVLVCVTNIIPMLGPFIGAVPSAFIILASEGWGKTAVFVIIILVIQQIDGNIIVPRIIGESTGISGFWVLFAIIVGGGLFGAPGVLIGVPVWSVIYAVTGMLVERHLRKKGLPVDTEDYYAQREGPEPDKPGGK